jgi:hypothetical protein
MKHHLPWWQKKNSLDLAGLSAGPLHLGFFFLQEILLLLFTHRAFTHPLSLSFSSYERYFDH